MNVKTREIIKENYCIYYKPNDKFNFDKLVWSNDDYSYMNRIIILYIKGN